MNTAKQTTNLIFKGAIVSLVLFQKPKILFDGVQTFFVAVSKLNLMPFVLGYLT